MCEHLQLDNVAICVHKILKIPHHLDFLHLIYTATSQPTVIILFSVFVSCYKFNDLSSFNCKWYFCWSIWSNVAFQIPMAHEIIKFRFFAVVRFLQGSIVRFFSLLSSMYQNSLHAIDNYGFHWNSHPNEFPYFDLNALNFDCGKWNECVCVRVESTLWTTIFNIYYDWIAPLLKQKFVEQNHFNFFLFTSAKAIWKQMKS